MGTDTKKISKQLKKLVKEIKKIRVVLELESEEFQNLNKNQSVKYIDSSKGETVKNIITEEPFKGDVFQLGDYKRETPRVVLADDLVPHCFYNNLKTNDEVLYFKGYYDLEKTVGVFDIFSLKGSRRDIKVRFCDLVLSEQP